MNLGSKTLPLPILQGGMGIGVSLDGLAGEVARCGGMGTISAALCGFHEPDFDLDPKGASLRALKKQILRAKEWAAGCGLVAVNVMVATAQYRECVCAALGAGADAIVCGAGLPVELPQLAREMGNTDTLLAPVVSSGRAAAALCRLWQRHGRLPDFLVLEGPLAGGHLGFAADEAELAQKGGGKTLEELLGEVLKAIAPYEKEKKIPVFVAGGIEDGGQMARLMQLGAAGAQFATRFITTKECDASDGYKQALLGCKTEDIAIVQSPVGMPGRALRSPLIRRVEEGKQPKAERCMRCITPCRPDKAPYCISRALIAAEQGDWENGLFFCGANAGRKKAITTVRAEMDRIMDEWRKAQ